MLVVAATAVFMFTGLKHTMNTKIDSDTDEKNGTDMPEPFLKSIHFLRQVSYAHCAVTYEPGYQHDRKTCAETENHRHKPVPTARKRQRDIYHRQEINQTVGTECNRKEDTENKRPKPAGVGIRILQELAYSVVMLMVMVTAEKQHDTADKHECRQNWFAPMRQHMLDALSLRPHEKRNAEQHVGRQFAQNEHSSVAQDLAFVGDFLVNITDGGNAGNQSARVEYSQ